MEPIPKEIDPDSLVVPFATTAVLTLARGSKLGYNDGHDPDTGNHAPQTP